MSVGAVDRRRDGSRTAVVRGPIAVARPCRARCPRGRGAVCSERSGRPRSVLLPQGPGGRRGEPGAGARARRGRPARARVDAARRSGATRGTGSTRSTSITWSDERMRRGVRTARDSSTSREPVAAGQGVHRGVAASRQLGRGRPGDGGARHRGVVGRRGAAPGRLVRAVRAHPRACGWTWSALADGGVGRTLNGRSPRAASSRWWPTGTSPGEVSRSRCSAPARRLPAGPALLRPATRRAARHGRRLRDARWDGARVPAAPVGARADGRPARRRRGADPRWPAAFEARSPRRPRNGTCSSRAGRVRSCAWRSPARTPGTTPAASRSTSRELAAQLRGRGHEVLVLAPLRRSQPRSPRVRASAGPSTSRTTTRTRRSTRAPWSRRAGARGASRASAPTSCTCTSPPRPAPRCGRRWRREVPVVATFHSGATTARGSTTWRRR